jgi:hypothetical protein
VMVESPDIGWLQVAGCELLVEQRGQHPRDQVRSKLLIHHKLKQHKINDL